MVHFDRKSLIQWYHLISSATCLLSNMLVHFNTPAQRLTSRTSNAVPALLRRFQQRTKNVVAVQKMGECFSPELLVASGADFSRNM